MTWVPIADSGVAYEFVSDAFGGGVALMDGSVVSTNPGEMAGGINWYIYFQASPLNVRLTAQSYSAGSGNVNQFFWASDQQSEPQQLTSNQAPSPTSWLPSPFELNIPAGQTNPFISNAAGEGEHGGYTASFLVEVDVGEVVSDDCREYGQVTKANVSGYTRSRIHQSRLYPMEARCLVANFNGAIPAGRTIANATWQTWNTPQVIMSDAALSESLREAQIRIKAQVSGVSIIKCSVTLDNGEVYVQNFRVCVLPAPVYSNTTRVTGPEILSVDAP